MVCGITSTILIATYLVGKATVGRSSAGRRAGAHLHAWRSGGVPSQARPRYQGHGAPASRSWWPDGPARRSAPFGGGGLDNVHTRCRCPDKADTGQIMVQQLVFSEAAPGQAAPASGRPRRTGPGMRGRRGTRLAGISRQAACAPVLRSVDRRSAADDRSSGGRSRRGRRADVPDPAHRRRRNHVRRRPDPKDVVACRRWHHLRVGVDALPAAQYRVHLIAGGLRHGLPVLCHRPGRIGPQPVDRGNPRAGACRCCSTARRLRRPALECGFHGHGGAVGQLRQGGELRCAASRSSHRTVSGSRPVR